MKLIYGHQKDQQHRSFKEMMRVARPGEVWVHLNSSESRMYAIMVRNSHGEVDCIIESGGQLVSVGDIGYNVWIQVEASGIRIEP